MLLERLFGAGVGILFLFFLAGTIANADDGNAWGAIVCAGFAALSAVFFVKGPL